MSTIKKTAFITGTLLLSASLLLSACAPKEEVQALLPGAEITAPAEANYKTVILENGNFVVSTAGELSLVYPHREELSWDQPGAHFEEVFVEKNQEVKEGDILMTFATPISAADSAELRLQRQRSWEAYLTGKQARLAAIEAAKEEAKALTGYDLQIANYEIEKLQAQYDQYVFQTTRSVYAIDDQIRELEGKAKNNVLVAPFDGVIDSVVTFNPGDPVTPHAVLITMHATDTLLLQVKNADDMLRYNLPVTIESGVKADLKRYNGRIVTAPNILPMSVSSDLVLVKLDEDITAADLDQYLSYQADCDVLQNVITIPRKAVLREEGKTFVYILEGNNLQKKYITAYFNSSANVWVQNGLSAGQTLVIE